MGYIEFIIITDIAFVAGLWLGILLGRDVFR